MRYIVLFLGIMQNSNDVTSLSPHKCKTTIINVTSADSLETVINNANEGDTIMLSAGTYLLTQITKDGSDTAHIHLKSNMHILGDKAGNTIIKSTLVSTQSAPKKYDQIDAIIRGKHITGVKISNIVIFGSSSEITRVSVPMDHILYFTDSTYIDLSNIVINYFYKSGIKLTDSSYCTVDHCQIEKALALTSGKGYGITIEGPHSQVNLVQNCIITGPKIRHGILLQTRTHHNSIKGNQIRNTVFDAIDCHGTGEYANTIMDNYIYDCIREAGIGVGQSSKGAAGDNNWIYNNNINNCAIGIRSYYKTKKTKIERNEIHNCSIPNGIGIAIIQSYNCIVKDNYIHDNTGKKFTALVLQSDHGSTEVSGNKIE